VLIFRIYDSWKIAEGVDVFLEVRRTFLTLEIFVILRVTLVSSLNSKIIITVLH